MRELLLVAASGLAREAVDAVRGYHVLGFVDDNSAKWGEVIGEHKVLGGLDVVRGHPKADVLLCAGKGSARHSLARRLRLDDHRYATVVHPSVHIPAGCTVGAGSIVLANAVFTADVTVGRHVVVMPHVTLTHDDVVSDFATLCAGVVLGSSVHVGERAYLGMACSVRERIRIAADTTIGMGAVVLRPVPPGETWVGVPAHRRAESAF